jgi:AMMECR1 domain-containing protein
MSDMFDFDMDKEGLFLKLFDHVNGLHSPSALYLPKVAKEQGWDKRETIANLILKTGVKAKDIAFSKDRGSDDGRSKYSIG